MGKHKKKKSKKRKRSSSDSSDAEVHVKGKDSEIKNTSNLIGPQLPLNLHNFSQESVDPGQYGPSLPPGLLVDSEDDESVIGPLPDTDEARKDQTQIALQERAEALRENFGKQDTSMAGNDIAKRETWMLELPKGKADKFGLGPRKFKKNDTGDKKSNLWTDSPSDNNNPQLQAKEEEIETDLYESKLLLEHDKAMEKIIENTKKKRTEKSLLEIHQEKQRIKKEEENKSKEERRPFNSEIDLQVNKFDEAQKKSILKKAQLLDTRFSQGQSKFL